MIARTFSIAIREGDCAVCVWLNEGPPNLPDLEFTAEQADAIGVLIREKAREAIEMRATTQAKKAQPEETN